MGTMTVNQVEYDVIKLLGKGKGGYSYLVKKDGQQYVLKQIHHEPCDYYTFGNKLEAEKRDYIKLKEAGIPIPRLIEVDEEQERILKEYIDGPTVYELVVEDKMRREFIAQAIKMSENAKMAGLNIDYFPTNFVLQNELLYYVDYECNPFMEEWSFENWGIKYWSKTEDFLRHLNDSKES